MATNTIASDHCFLVWGADGEQPQVVVDTRPDALKAVRGIFPGRCVLAVRELLVFQELSTTKVFTNGNDWSVGVDPLPSAVLCLVGVEHKRMRSVSSLLGAWETFVGRADLDIAITPAKTRL